MNGKPQQEFAGIAVANPAFSDSEKTRSSGSGGQKEEETVLSKP